jgi:hypothetical protein
MQAWSAKALNLADRIAEMKSTPLVAILSSLHDEHAPHRFRDLRAPLWLHIKPLQEKRARNRTGVDEDGDRHHFACPLIECTKWYKQRGWLSNHIRKKHGHLQHSQRELWNVISNPIDKNVDHWEVPAGLPVRATVHVEDVDDDDAINAVEHDE